MSQKVRMRVYAPDWNTNFMDELPVYQSNDAKPGETVKQVVCIPLPFTKIKKVKAK